VLQDGQERLEVQHLGIHLFQQAWKGQRKPHEQMLRGAESQDSLAPAWQHSVLSAQLLLDGTLSQ
jgi:hypothetical protein